MRRANSASAIPLPCLDLLIGGAKLELVKTDDMMLPHYIYDDYPRISPLQLAELMRNPSGFGYQELLILDSRYIYEFQNGHIQNSVFVDMDDDMFMHKVFEHKESKVAIVIYSEFSKYRGLVTYSMIRNADRDANTLRYPNVFFTEMYILEGGYEKFYKEFGCFCVGGYTKMRDEQYIINGELRRSYSETKKRSCFGFDIQRNVPGSIDIPIMSLAGFDASQ